MTRTSVPDIVFENDDFVAINKPHGLLVHRTNLAKDAEQFALQLIRDYLEHRVYPVHRLDRKTSGVLLFAKSKKANSAIQQLFREHKVIKVYRAIVRGFVAEEGVIDYPLNDGCKLQQAVTEYRLVRHFEVDQALGKFATSRYSLVELYPRNGRYHQLRKHMAHIFHPIIGDRPHGCNKQNKMWKEEFNMTTMFLHAASLEISSTDYGLIKMSAPLSPEFQNALKLMKSLEIQPTNYESTVNM